MYSKAVSFQMHALTPDLITAESQGYSFTNYWKHGAKVPPIHYSSIFQFTDVLD